MEEVEKALEIYYSTLYWKAFFFGILIPSIMFSIYYYFTIRGVMKQIENSLAQMDKAYDDMIISKYEDQIEFLQSMIDREKGNDS
jgi:hypothetical protein